MPIGTTERLLRRTRRRLFAVTMALLALLVVGVGAATAVVALRVLDSDVDHALIEAVDGRAAAAVNEVGGDNGPVDADAGADPDRPTGQSDTFVLVLDTSGQVVENRSNSLISGSTSEEVVT